MWELPGLFTTGYRMKAEKQKSLVGKSRSKESQNVTKRDEVTDIDDCKRKKKKLRSTCKNILKSNMKTKSCKKYK